MEQKNQTKGRVETGTVYKRNKDLPIKGESEGRLQETRTGVRNKTQRRKKELRKLRS